MRLSDLSLTRAMRTEDELRGLVEAIHCAPAGTQETNWLEWKNGVDLTTAEGKFAVAKAILGFANRSVQQAQLACEGVAYIVVGAAPGAAAGVGTIDHADLGQGINAYARGTRWTPFYIPFYGVTVLVVVVEPPRPGDPIHPLRKANDRFGRGTIFHRSTAHTEPADPEDIDMLSQRLVQNLQRPQLDLSLGCSAHPIVRLRVEPEQLDEWLRRREAHVRENCDKPSDRPTPPRKSGGPAGLAGLAAFDFSSGIASSLIGGLYASPEDAAKFETRLEAYLAKMRHLIPQRVVRAIVLDDADNKVRFQVENDTDDPVSGVQLTARIPKNGILVLTSPPGVENFPPRPKWPNPVDEMRLNTLADMVRSPALDFDPRTAPVVANGDYYDVTWNVGDLRPRQQSGSFNITVVAGPDAPEEISVEMIASAMDRTGTRTTAAVLKISPREWAVDDFYDAGS